MATNLECLTKPSHFVEIYQGAAERDEGKVDIVTTLVAHCRLAQPGHLGISALDHPPVRAETPAAVVVLACNAGLDARLTAFRPATAAVISLVGMELVGPAGRTAPFA